MSSTTLPAATHQVKREGGKPLSDAVTNVKRQRVGNAEKPSPQRRPLTRAVHVGFDPLSLSSNIHSPETPSSSARGQPPKRRNLRSQAPGEKATPKAK